MWRVYELTSFQVYEMNKGTNKIYEEKKKNTRNNGYRKLMVIMFLKQGGRGGEGMRQQKEVEIEVGGKVVYIN